MVTGNFELTMCFSAAMFKVVLYIVVKIIFIGDLFIQLIEITDSTDITDLGFKRCHGYVKHDFH